MAPRIPYLQQILTIGFSHLCPLRAMRNQQFLFKLLLLYFLEYSASKRIWKIHIFHILRALVTVSRKVFSSSKYMRLFCFKKSRMDRFWIFFSDCRIYENLSLTLAIDNLPFFHFAWELGTSCSEQRSWHIILKCKVSLILIYILVFPYCPVPEKLFLEFDAILGLYFFFRLNMFSVFLRPWTAIYIIWIVCLHRSHSLDSFQFFTRQISRLIYKNLLFITSLFRSWR